MLGPLATVHAVNLLPVARVLVFNGKLSTSAELLLGFLAIQVDLTSMHFSNYTHAHVQALSLGQHRPSLTRTCSQLPACVLTKLA